VQKFKAMHCKKLIDKIITKQLKRKQIFPPYETNLKKYEDTVNEIYRVVERKNIQSIKTIMGVCKMMFPHKIGGTFFKVDNWYVEMDSDKKTNKMFIIKYRDDFEDDQGADVTKDEFLDLLKRLNEEQG